MFSVVAGSAQTHTTAEGEVVLLQLQQPNIRELQRLEKLREKNLIVA